MNKAIYLGMILATCLHAGNVWAEGAAFRDDRITTTDRSCAIHYATRRNTTGWFLSDVDGSCPNGWLNGSATITIRDAFTKPVEQISGFWVDGYRTEPIALPVSINDINDDGTGIRTLSFDMGREERLDIRYVGRMTAEPLADGTYGPFMACAPVQILAVTSDISLFEDETIQQELINTAINQAHFLCPRATHIYFYAADTDRPENKDVAFFADIDLDGRKIKVKRVPSSSRIRDILKNPDQGIPVPRIVRQSTGTPVMQVQPIKQTKQESAPTLSAVSQRPLTPIARTISPQPAIASPQQKPVPAPQSEPKVPVLSSTANPEPPQSQVSTDQPTPPVLDALPHLLTAARLLKQPVDGKALVHIAGFDDSGAAVIDQPVALRATGTGLSLGWGIAEGLYSYTPPAGTLPTVRGFVQIHTFTPTSDTGGL